MADSAFEAWYFEQEGFALRAERLTGPKDELQAAFEAGRAAAIEAITAGQFVEYRITSPDGELFAETAGTPAAAFAEAQHYAMQEPGAVIEQVVCLPALFPSLKEQERT